MRSPILPMIADSSLGVYPSPVPDDRGGSGAPGMLRARPLSALFSSMDESWGCISVAWHGPPYAPWSTWMHLSLLWDYLARSVASPLQLAFVENDDPICTDLGPAHDVFTKGYHQLWFQEVNVDRMDEVVDLGGRQWCQRWGGRFRPVEDAHCHILTMTTATMTAAAAATAAAAVAAVVVTAAVETADVVAAVVTVTVAMAVMAMAVMAAATMTRKGNMGCSVSVSGDSFYDCSGNNDGSESGDGLHRRWCRRRLQQQQQCW